MLTHVVAACGKFSFFKSTTINWPSINIGQSCVAEYILTSAGDLKVNNLVYITDLYIHALRVDLVEKVMEQKHYYHVKLCNMECCFRLK